jgi:hypothetical protein
MRSNLLAKKWNDVLDVFAVVVVVVVVSFDIIYSLLTTFVSCFDND